MFQKWTPCVYVPQRWTQDIWVVEQNINKQLFLFYFCYHNSIHFSFYLLKKLHKLERVFKNESLLNKP